MEDAMPAEPASSADLPGLSRFQPLNASEARILAGVRSGVFDRLGDGLCPGWEDPSRMVRAELLRYLILGGDEQPFHEKGLRLSGAVVTGVLDLEGCRIPRDIALKDCLFVVTPVLRSAVIDNLFLDGSTLPGLQADRVEARGGVSVRGATVNGPIQLQGARLGGSLEADGAKILRKDRLAIDAQGMEAGGGVLLRGTLIRGGISLTGARLGADVNAVGANIERPGELAFDGDGIIARGDLALRGATIAGEVRLRGASFGGDLDCTAATLSTPGGHAVRLNRARIAGAFFLRQGASVDGALDMTATVIGAIDDDRPSWPGPGDLLLNRCRYGAFIGGPVDARNRLEWLARQQPGRWGQDFWPQPYEHLANVLREMGHNEDASAVLIDKERRQRRARRARAGNPLLRLALTTTDGLLAITVRYGRQPLLTFVWLLVFWILGGVVFHIAALNGALKPNSPVVLRSLEWTMCDLDDTRTRYMPTAGQVLQGRAAPGQNQLDCFLRQPEAASYPEFNAWMYSLDALLPVMEIGQKQYWRPNPAEPRGGVTLNYYYLLSVVGWGLSLLAVAGFSGLVKSK